jgi:hypothetical protein
MVTCIRQDTALLLIIGFVEFSQLVITSISSSLIYYTFCKSFFVFVTFEVFTAMIMNAVFWGVTPCSSRENRRFGGKYRLHHQGDKNR